MGLKWFMGCDCECECVMCNEHGDVWVDICSTSRWVICITHSAYTQQLRHRCRLVSHWFAVHHYDEDG